MAVYSMPCFILALTAVLNGPAGPALNVKPEYLCSRLISATAWIRTKTQGVGTGWIADRGRRWLVTCLHVVGDQDRAEVIFPVRREGAWITERAHYIENQQALHEQGTAVWGKVILRQEKADLALIELEQIPERVTELRLSEHLPGISDKVHSVGHRHDCEALWIYSTGAVRQTGRLAEGYFWRGKRLAAGSLALVVQSPINIGDSGSALVNERGNVVGVLSAVRWQTPAAA